MIATKIRTEIQKVSNKDRQKAMEAYMRNKFSFFGVPSPKLSEVHKLIYKKYPIATYKELKETVLDLYSFKERECHYTALFLIEKYNKLWTKQSITLFEKLIVTHSWWDTIDSISTRLVGLYFKLYPDQIPVYTQKWISGNNLWKKRVAIIFQLLYKDTTDWNILKSMCIHESQNKEFFMQTAIGWALRQYSKVNKKVVKDFVRDVPLYPRAKKEALIFIQGKTS